jgi:hypothetical protein
MGDALWPERRLLAQAIGPQELPILEVEGEDDAAGRIALRQVIDRGRIALRFAADDEIAIFLLQPVRQAPALASPLSTQNRRSGKCRRSPAMTGPLSPFPVMASRSAM